MRRWAWPASAAEADGHAAAAAKCPFLAGKAGKGGGKKRPIMLGPMPLHCWFYTAGLVAAVGAVGFGLTSFFKAE